jgi:hypothetical protein
VTALAFTVACGVALCVALLAAAKRRPAVAVYALTGLRDPWLIVPVVAAALIAEVAL